MYTVCCLQYAVCLQLFLDYGGMFQDLLTGFYTNYTVKIKTFIYIYPVQKHKSTEKLLVVAQSTCVDFKVHGCFE